MVVTNVYGTLQESQWRTAMPRVWRPGNYLPGETHQACGDFNREGRSDLVRSGLVDVSDDAENGVGGVEPARFEEAGGGMAHIVHRCVVMFHTLPDGGHLYHSLAFEEIAVDHALGPLLTDARSDQMPKNSALLASSLDALAIDRITFYLLGSLSVRKNS